MCFSEHLYKFQYVFLYVFSRSFVHNEDTYLDEYPCRIQWYYLHDLCTDLQTQCHDLYHTCYVLWVRCYVLYYECHDL